MSAEKVRILILADSDSDAATIQKVLGGVPDGPLTRHECERVNYLRALEEFQPDCIIADLNTQGFAALEALQLAQERRPMASFVLVSSDGDQEVMSACWQHGANSCVLKSRLAQLPGVIISAGRKSAQSGHNQKEWEQLQEHFRQAQKLEVLGSLAGGVAHDFNNLLTVIRGRSEMLLTDATLPEEASDSLKHVIQAADRATSLTRQLVAFSRKQPALIQPLNLTSTLNNLVKLLRHIIGEDIEVETRLGSTPLWTPADQGMVEQLILNLAANARSALPRGGKVVISLLADSIPPQCAAASSPRPGGWICLNFQYSEHPPQAPALEFFGLANSDREFDRTCLGTAAMRTIVELLGGKIALPADSRTGTSIYLPFLRPPADSSTTENPLKRLSGGSERVLIVEDDLGLRTFMGLLLQKLGYKVREATNGLEAVTLWKENSGEFDLLVSDVVMPSGVNGWDLALQLRESHPNLRVVIVSGHERAPIKLPASLEHGLRFLQKPFKPEALAEAIRDCLDEL